MSHQTPPTRSHPTVMQQTATTRDFIYKEQWILSTQPPTLGEAGELAGVVPELMAPLILTRCVQAPCLDLNEKAAYSLYNSAVWRFENSTFACTKSFFFFFYSHLFFFLPLNMTKALRPSRASLYYFKMCRCVIQSHTLPHYFSFSKNTLCKFVFIAVRAAFFSWMAVINGCRIRT